MTDYPSSASQPQNDPPQNKQARNKPADSGRDDRASDQEADGFDLAELLRNRVDTIAAPEHMYSEVARRHRKIVRRRSGTRLAMAGASIVAVTFGLAALAQGTGPGLSSDDMSIAAGDGAEVPVDGGVDGTYGSAAIGGQCTLMGQNEAVVWVGPNASPADLDVVRLAIAESPAVESSYTNKAETWANFAETYADDPEILAIVTEAVMPTSFQVRFESEQIAKEMASEFTKLSGVSDVQTFSDAEVCDEEPDAPEELTVPASEGVKGEYSRCPAEGQETATVWMDPWTSSEAIAAAKEAIVVQLPEAAIRYVNQDETLVEFLAINADHPGFREIDAADMSPSFLVTLDSDSTWRATRDELASLTGVSLVERLGYENCAGQSVVPSRLQIVSVDDDGASIEAPRYDDVCFDVAEGHAVVRIIDTTDFGTFTDLPAYLRDSNWGSPVKYVERDLAWWDFQERNRANAGGPVSSLDTTNWPPIFVVALKSDVAETAFKGDILRRFDGVAVQLSDDQCDDAVRLAPTRIWMSPRATQDEIDSILSKLNNSADVASVRLVDRVEGRHVLAECFYRYRLDWPEQIQGSDIPAWFEVELQPNVMGLNIRSDALLYQGVEHIDFYDSIC